MEKVDRNTSIRVTLSCSASMTLRQQAVKLHRQFAHPPPRKAVETFEAGWY